MFKQHFFYGFMLFFATFMSVACEGPVGPEGPAGPTGQQGPQGPAGATASMDEETLFFSDFVEGTNSNWYDLFSTTVNPDDLVSVFAKLPIDGTVYEWAALPVNNYYSSSTSVYNHFSFTVAESGTIWAYIRNSAGNQPLTNSSSVAYKIFIVPSHNLVAFEETGINPKDYDAMLGYASEHFDVKVLDTNGKDSN